MGLFGLFASMVGLGAMAKDGISNYFCEQRAYDKAVRDGDDWYMTGRGGEMKAVSTGRRCRIDYGKNGTKLIDSDSGKVLIDYELQRREKAAKEKNQMLREKGFAFYVKPEIKGRVYFNNRIPGYFVHYNPNQKYSSEVFDENSVFIRTDKLREKYNGTVEPELSVGYQDNADFYRYNGVKCTVEDGIAKENLRRIEYAEENGNKFWNRVLDGHLHYGKLVVDKSELIDLKTEKPFIHNKQKSYYVEAIPEEYQVNVALPHHKPVYETRTRMVENPYKGKYNLDGTRWFDEDPEEKYCDVKIIKHDEHKRRSRRVGGRGV